jgi:hypothetical protein
MAEGNRRSVARFVWGPPVLEVQGSTTDGPNEHWPKARIRTGPIREPFNLLWFFLLHKSKEALRISYLTNFFSQKKFNKLFAPVNPTLY